MNNYISLHCSTQYAEDASAFSVKGLIDEAIKLKQEVIAITDLNSTQAFLEAEKYARGKIRIIYGLRLSFHYDDIIILLAKNKAGFRALNIMLSLSKKKKLTEEVISKYRKDLFIGCEFLNDRMHQILFVNDKDEVRHFMEFFDYFEFFYSHTTESSFAAKIHYKNLISICSVYDKPLYSTFNVTYPNNKIGKITYKLMQKIKPHLEMVYGHFPTNLSKNSDFYNSYLQDPHEIVNRVEEFSISPQNRMLPEIKDGEEILTRLVYDYAKQTYKNQINEEIKEIIDFELAEIIDKNYVAHYLYMHYIKHDKCMKSIVKLNTLNIQNNLILSLLQITDKPPDMLLAKVVEPSIKLEVDSGNYLQFINIAQGFFGKNMVLGTESNFCLPSWQAKAKFNDYIHMICKDVTDIEKNRIIDNITGFKVSEGMCSRNVIIIPKGFDVYDITPVYDVRRPEEGGIDCAQVEERLLKKYFLVIEIE